MQGFWDFLTKNRDAMAGIMAIGSIVAAIWGGWRLLIQRRWKQKLLVEVKVFEVITDPTVLLPKLYATEKDDSPLADHNIKYQPRDPNRDIQAELKAALNRSRYLLITAPTGYGKTREAGVLAQTMMSEGWQVLRVKTGWLDVPKVFPVELNNNRSRIVILLDDLNGLFRTGELIQSPRTEEILAFSQATYHDRLLQVLDIFEEVFAGYEIRVLATARNEADEWKILNYSAKDKLWKRFEIFELPDVTDSALVNLLEYATKQAHLEANQEDFESIVRKSDHTHRNILLNLRRWRVQKRGVNKDDFTETLNGAWLNIYERAEERYPAVKYIYEAIDVLRQAGIGLFPSLVESTALSIWGGKGFQNLLRRRKIRQALHYLTKGASILPLANGELKPRYGQIEVKQSRVNWKSHTSSLQNTLVKFAKNYREQSSYSILKFGITLYQAGQIQNAILIWRNGVKIAPDNMAFWTNLGIAYATSPRDSRKGRYKGITRRIARSVSGISLPFLGLSWIPPEGEVDKARKLLITLEDQRLLLEDLEGFLNKLDDPIQYAQNILSEMRSSINAELIHLEDFSPLAEIMSAMRAACRECSDRLDKNKTIKQNMSALNNLRAVFGLWISILCAHYQLTINENELKSILPKIREAM